MGWDGLSENAGLDRCFLTINGVRSKRGAFIRLRRSNAVRRSVCNVSWLGK